MEPSAPGRGATPSRLGTGLCWIVLGAVLTLLATYAVLALYPLAQFGFPSSSLAQLQGTIEGYLIAVEKRGNQDVLVVLDPRTGVTHQLLPQSPNLLAGGSSAQAPDNDSLIMPAYSPARRTLAYISIAADGAHSLWIIPLEVSGKSIPHANPSDSRRLLADCGPHCNTQTWSPSGKWLIFEGISGLMAIDSDTGKERPITQDSHDAWPACSPDGTLLVYQHAVESLGYLVAVAAEDCIPAPEALARARLVGAPIVSWHPTWSPDGRMLAYVSASTGRRVFVLDALGLFAGPTDSDQVSFHPVSQAGCADPVWVVETQTHRNLVIYICASQPAQRLVGVPVEGQNDEQFAIGAPRIGEPALYNPLWVRP